MRKEIGREIRVRELGGANSREPPFIDDTIQLQPLQLFDHAQFVFSPFNAADQGLKPRRPAGNVILDGVGASAIDGKLMNANPGTRRRDFLSAREAADSEG